MSQLIYNSRLHDVMGSGKLSTAEIRPASDSDPERLLNTLIIIEFLISLIGGVFAAIFGAVWFCKSGMYDPAGTIALGPSIFVFLGLPLAVVAVTLVTWVVVGKIFRRRVESVRRDLDAMLLAICIGEPDEEPFEALLTVKRLQFARIKLKIPIGESSDTNWEEASLERLSQISVQQSWA